MFTRRPLLSVILAVAAGFGFVILRMFYRVLFGGASQGETLLPHLPSIRLPGVFSHIVVLGPVTAEGLATAARDALPFAIVIVLTGSVLAWWDPRTLLTRVSPGNPFRVIAWATGIALATLPVLVQQAGALRQSALTRGLRSRWAIVTALAETTLERSIGLAATLWSRGLWGHRAPVSNEPSRVSLPVLDHWALPPRVPTPLSWVIDRPGLHVLTGPTGVGKTTVLEGLAGIPTVFGDQPSLGQVLTGVGSGPVALLPHHPHTLFVTARLVDDVALSIPPEGLEGNTAKGLAQDILERAGLGHCALRDPQTLSTGEATLAALVTLLPSCPRLLLLDEPLGGLDRTSQGAFLRMLRDYLDAHPAVAIMTDHRRGVAVPWAAGLWQLGEKGIVKGAWMGAAQPSAVVPGHRPAERDTVLEVTGLDVTVGLRQVVRDVSFTVGRGDVVVITGDNGAGKTSLLNHIVSPPKRKVLSGGRDLSRVSPWKRRDLVAAVPADPRDFFLTSTVADELALADRGSGLPEGTALLTLSSILPKRWWGSDEDFLATHPRDLSRGQATALALALQLVARPLVVLLDEPTRGLDEDSRRFLGEVMGCVVETGVAVVVTTHDDEVLDWGVDTHLVCAGGRVTRYPLPDREVIR